MTKHSTIPVSVHPGTGQQSRNEPEATAAIRAYCQESARLLTATGDCCSFEIWQAAECLSRVIASGGKVLLCGNGGSAADAQHCAAEFVSGLTKRYQRPALAALALTTDTSFLTAYANDFDFSGVFARQVDALGKQGDALVLISTSGQSENLLQAAAAAAARGITTVGLLGGDGGRLRAQVTCAITVPAQDAQHVQECHTAIFHIICALVEQRVIGQPA